MDTLDNVPRTRSISPEAYRDLLKKDTPLLIEEPFAGQPIRDLRTLESVRQRLGSLSIEIMDNYITTGPRQVIEFLKGGASPKDRILARTPSTIGEYLDHVEKNPKSQKMSGDRRTPDEIVKMFGPCTYWGDWGRVYPVMFLANAGNASDMHTDWTGIHAFLYQVFGRKRAILIPPSASRKVMPFETFGLVRLREFSVQEKLDFVRYCGGYECILNPGEALIIPPFYWHHLEYVDAGMGVSFRSGDINEYVKFMLDNLHRDVYVQNIILSMLDADVVEKKYKPQFLEIKTAFEKRYRNSREKYLKMRDVTQKVCREIYGDGLEPFTWVDQSELAESVLCSQYDTTRRDRVRLALRRAAYRLVSRL